MDEDQPTAAASTATAVESSTSNRAAASTSVAADDVEPQEDRQLPLRPCSLRPYVHYGINRHAGNLICSSVGCCWEPCCTCNRPSQKRVRAVANQVHPDAEFLPTGEMVPVNVGQLPFLHPLRDQLPHECLLPVGIGKKLMHDWNIFRERQFKNRLENNSISGRLQRLSFGRLSPPDPPARRKQSPILGDVRCPERGGTVGKRRFTAEVECAAKNFRMGLESDRPFFVPAKLSTAKYWEHLFNHYKQGTDCSDDVIRDAISFHPVRQNYERVYPPWTVVPTSPATTAAGATSPTATPMTTTTTTV